MQEARQAFNEAVKCTSTPLLAISLVTLHQRIVSDEQREDSNGATGKFLKII